MSNPSSILATLKAQGHRITSARRAIVDAFGKKCEPLSAQDVHARLKSKTNITTVYRELQFLAEQGIIHTVQFEDGVVRYELSGDDHHHHLICMQCKSVEEIHIDHDDIGALEKTIAKSKNFRVVRHALEFYGVCKKCQ